MIVSFRFFLARWILLILFATTLVDSSYAQEFSSRHQKIDSLIKSTDLLSRNSDMLKSAGKKVRRAAQKTDYSKGRAYGNLMLARYMYLANNFQKSVSFLEDAQKEKEVLSFDPWLNAYISYLYSQNYLFVGLRSPAKQYLYKALKQIKKENPNSQKKEKLTAIIYRKFMGQYSRVSKPDSVRLYIYEYENLDFNFFEPSNAYANTMRGWLHFTNGELDSAHYDYEKGYTQIDDKREHAYTIALLSLGRIAYQKQNYKQSLQYFLEGLPYAPFPPIKIAFYKYLADSYKKLENAQKNHHFLERYKTAQDSIQAVNRVRRKAMSNKYYDNHQHVEQKTVFSNFRAFAFILVLVVLVAGGFLIYYFRINGNEAADLSSQKQGSEQTDQDNFEKLVELAKNNDSSFLAHFREVYPQVLNNITALEPSLTRSEQVLCAMIWLGFDTKDIARYISIQPKSVQMKKYRLRKKMDLAKGKDLQEWIKNL